MVLPSALPDNTRGPDYNSQQITKTANRDECTESSNRFAVAKDRGKEKAGGQFLGGSDALLGYWYLVSITAVSM